MTVVKPIYKTNLKLISLRIESSGNPFNYIEGVSPSNRVEDFGKSHIYLR